VSDDQDEQFKPGGVVPPAGAIDAFLAAQVRAMTEMWRQVQPALQPLVDLYERDPQAFERLRHEREHERSCHCMCGLHQDRPEVECTMRGELTRTIHSPTVGTTHVPMCRPCYDATAVPA